MDEEDSTQELNVSENLDYELTDNLWFWTMVVSWLILPLAALGLLGNCLVLAVRLRRGMQSSINVLLIGLTLSDIGLQIFGTIATVPPGLCSYYDFTLKDPKCTKPLGYIVKWINPLYHLFNTLSTYVLTLISIERFIAICHPFMVKKISSQRSAVIFLVLILSFSLAFNLSLFFELDLVERNGTLVNIPALASDPFYKRFYTMWLYLVVMFVLPFITMSYATLKIIWELRGMARFQQLMTRADRREHSTTVMLLLIVCVFLVSHTLPFAIRVYTVTDFEKKIAEQSSNSNGSSPEVYSGSDWQVFVVIKFLLMVSFALILVNTALNFPIYCRFSQQFQRGFLRILGREIDSNEESVAGRLNSRVNLVSQPKSSVALYTSGINGTEQSLRTEIYSKKSRMSLDIPPLSDSPIICRTKSTAQ